jgi:antitoxin VapB
MQSATEGQSNLTLAQLNEISGEARGPELEEKYRRLAEFLDRQQLEGLLLRRYENVSWLTAGQVEARVGIPTETGVASLLVLRDGRRFYFAPENEAPRLAAEEFTGLDYEPVLAPWYADTASAEAIARIAGKGRIGSDAGANPVDLSTLRAPLTPSEIARFRWLCAATANVVESALQALEPGDTEYEMEGEVARLLLAEGILPSVLLMAVDERILSYKHAVARGAELKRFGMINLCTRKWGLAASITRFVHFGAMPAELVRGFEVAAQVNAELLHATRDGATGAKLYKVAAATYAAAGFPGEEKLHHQGGPCGYSERDWVATPDGQQVVTTPQAFAWNPSCRGGKVEDTVLVSELGAEVLTETLELPVVETPVGGISYRSAGVLIQD